MDDNIFEERIRPLFDASGKTDKDIEDALHLPRGIIYKWKNGKNKNWKMYFIEISEFFHVSTDYLMGRSDDPSSKKESSPGKKTWTAEELDELSDKELAKLLSDAAAALERRSSKG